MTQSPHIIIVDDEAPAREMVGDYLKMHGFSVTLCDGGKSLRGVIDNQRARSRGARSQHARGRRAVDHPRPQEPHQRARHHADGDRKPDRPRRRARTRRRRLHRKAVRTARIDGADSLGAAPERAGQGGHGCRGSFGRARPAKDQLVRFGTKWLDLEAQALRDDEGNEHPLTASEFGLLKVFRSQSQAGAVARAAAGTRQCARRRGLRPRRRSPDHADPAQDRDRPDQARGDPHHQGRRLSVSRRPATRPEAFVTPSPALARSRRAKLALRLVRASIGQCCGQLKYLYPLQQHQHLKMRSDLAGTSPARYENNSSTHPDRGTLPRQLNLPPFYAH